MNPAPGFFPPFSRLSACLSGGRSPLRWRRDLSRAVELLTRISRACEWLEELRAVQLRLCGQPRWGSCLEILTEFITLPLEEAAAERRPRRASFNQPQPTAPSGRTSAMNNASAVRSQHPDIPSSPLRKRPQPAFTQLQPQADRLLLSRLAGHSDFTRDVSERPPFSIEARAPRSIPPLASMREPAAHNDWLDGVARRAERALRPDLLTRTCAPRPAPLDVQETHERPPLVAHWPEPASSPSDSVDFQHRTPGSNEREPLSADSHNSVERPGLATQWSNPIDGPSLPAELLARLAGLAESIESGPRHDAGRETAQQPGASSGRTPSGSSTSTRQRGHWQTEAPAHPHRSVDRADAFVSEADDLIREPSQGSSRSRPSDRVSAISPSGSTRFSTTHQTGASQPPDRELAATTPPTWLDTSRPIGSGDGESPSPARIAPPAVAPGLAPLLPPAGPAATIAPLASAIARRGARAEEAASEEDLTRLAIGIKRILDEQARRHGIDV
jgi:hypothetical protein